MADLRLGGSQNGKVGAAIRNLNGPYRVSFDAWPSDARFGGQVPVFSRRFQLEIGRRDDYTGACRVRVDSESPQRPLLR